LGFSSAGARAHIVIAQNFAMDWSMLWKDLAGGILIPTRLGCKCVKCITLSRAEERYDT
jgi:hypothetical protein